MKLRRWGRITLAKDEGEGAEKSIICLKFGKKKKKVVPYEELETISVLRGLSSGFYCLHFLSVMFVSFSKNVNI